MSPTARIQPQAHLRPLTSLRIIAAMAVVVFHFGTQFFDAAGQRIAAAGQGGPMSWVLAAAGAGVRDIGRSGYVAVSLFFVLSGFVLAYNYLDRIEDRTFRIREFFIARLARMYPLYLLGLILAAPFAVSGYFERYSASAATARLGVSLASTAGLSQAWLPQFALAWNGPAWAVSAEAFFYLLFPLIAWMVLRAANTRQLLRWMLIAWLAQLMLPTLYMLSNPDGLSWAQFLSNGRLTTGSHVWLKVVKFCPAARLGECVLGVLLGRLYLEDRTVGRRVNGGPLAALAGAGIVLALAVSSVLPYPLLHNGLLFPLFGMLIYGLAHRGNRGILSHPLFARLGESSYALYIVHVPLGWMLIWSARQIGWGDLSRPLRYPAAVPDLAFFLVFCVILLGTSLALLRFFETPARNWIRAAMKPRRPERWQPVAPRAAA